MHGPARHLHPPTRKLGFREFVAMIAMIMALNAFAIDAMLPALPEIGEALGVANPNDRQWIMTVYLLGFGVAQLAYGTLSDRYGRRPVLLVSIALYVVFSVMAALAGSFTVMLIARGLQGAASASCRVLTVSIVRDCYKGREMARVMSLAFIVFLLVPILAPSIGQLILYVAPWRWIFAAFAISGAIVGVWCFLRLPETLHPEYRRPITPRQIATAWRAVFADRYSVGYTLAMTAMMGGLFGFINSVQQVFYDVLHEERLFPLIFALVAGSMAVTSYLNSRIVERLGTRRVSHTGVILFVLFAAIHLGVALAGYENIWTFAILQALMMSCFGLTGGNFGSMAMESLGRVAGTASAVQGFISTIGASLVGILIGQSFDGTTVPLYTGFVLCGLTAILIVLVTERGKLFRPHQAPDASHPAVAAAPGRAAE